MGGGEKPKHRGQGLSQRIAAGPQTTHDPAIHNRNIKHAIALFSSPSGVVAQRSNNHRLST